MRITAILPLVLATSAVASDWKLSRYSSGADAGECKGYAEDITLDGSKEAGCTATKVADTDGLKFSGGDYKVTFYKTVSGEGGDRKCSDEVKPKDGCVKGAQGYKVSWYNRRDVEEIGADSVTSRSRRNRSIRPKVPSFHDSTRASKEGLSDIWLYSRGNLCNMPNAGV